VKTPGSSIGARVPILLFPKKNSKQRGEKVEGGGSVLFCSIYYLMVKL